jgi:hypothetical protein
LINGRLNFDDIVGEIVNLATKGVIKITDTYHEIPFLPDAPDVVLTKLTDDSSLDEAQRKVLNLFFTWDKEVLLFQASKKPGFRNHFRRKFKDLERYLDNKMIEEGLFDQKNTDSLITQEHWLDYLFFNVFWGNYCRRRPAIFDCEGGGDFIFFRNHYAFAFLRQILGFLYPKGFGYFAKA